MQLDNVKLEMDFFFFLSNSSYDVQCIKVIWNITKQHLFVKCSQVVYWVFIFSQSAVIFYILNVSFNVIYFQMFCFYVTVICYVFKKIVWTAPLFCHSLINKKIIFVKLEFDFFFSWKLASTTEYKIKKRQLQVLSHNSDFTSCNCKLQEIQC